MECTTIGTSTSRCPNQASFLDVPLELRQLIYVRFFRDGHLPIHAAHCTCDVELSSPQQSAHDARGLRQTCRQIRDEAEPYIWPDTWFIMAPCKKPTNTQSCPSWLKVQKLILTNKGSFESMTTTSLTNEYPLLTSLTRAMLVGDLNHLHIGWHHDLDDPLCVKSLKTIITLCRGTSITCFLGCSRSYGEAIFRVKAKVSIMKTYSVKVRVYKGAMLALTPLNQYFRRCYGPVDWERTQFDSKYAADEDDATWRCVHHI